MITNLENMVHNSLRPNTVNKEIGKERQGLRNTALTSESPENLAVRKNQHPLCTGIPRSAHEVQGLV